MSFSGRVEEEQGEEGGGRCRRGERRREKEEEALCGRSTSRPTRMTRRQSFGISVRKNEISRRGLGYRGGEWKRGAIPCHSSPSFSTKHGRDACPLLPPQRRPIDILALRALVVLLPRRATGASIISVTGIGESSSIKGPISDDKDLEMNGPRHSNGSLSSCPTARFSAIPPLPLRKQSCFELLITLWRIRANNYGQVLTTHPSWFRRRILVFTYFAPFRSDKSKRRNYRSGKNCTGRIRFGTSFWEILVERAEGREKGGRRESIFFLISMQNTRNPSWFVLLAVDIHGFDGAKNPVTLVSRPPLSFTCPCTRYANGGTTESRIRQIHPPAYFSSLFFLARLRRETTIADRRQPIPLPDLTARATFPDTFSFFRPCDAIVLSA